MILRALLFATLVLSPASLDGCETANAEASASTLLRVPLIFHLAEQGGSAVADTAFLEEQLERANEQFRQLDFELVAQATVPLAERHAELVTRRDRDALARYVRRGAIHCFIVAKLMDVDEAGRERRGVHWHPRTFPGRHYVIVSKISAPYVLAHELAHYFDNPQHSDVPGNLLSYARGEGAPFLDETQKQRVRAALARMVQRGDIRPLRAP